MIASVKRRRRRRRRDGLGFVNNQTTRSMSPPTTSEMFTEKEDARISGAWVDSGDEEFELPRRRKFLSRDGDFAGLHKG